MITGFGSIDSAVESMKLGAFDYIGKPFNLEEFILKFDKAVENINLYKKVENLRQQVDENVIIQQYNRQKPQNAECI